MPTCEKCSSVFPNRSKIGDRTVVLNTRRYCLSCSPWGMHNTRPMHVERRIKYGCRCGETDPSRFYGRKHLVCASCHNRDTAERGRDNRVFAINELGGRCSLCGFSDFIEAIDIHHLDPLVKDASFRNMRGWSKGRILEEIKTCVALCRNCHAGVHSGNRYLKTGD